MFYFTYLLSSKLNAILINPQPEPPGKSKGSKILKPGTKEGFTPQPEPPGISKLKDKRTHRMGIVIIELNALVGKYHNKAKM